MGIISIEFNVPSRASGHEPRILVNNSDGSNGSIVMNYDQSGDMESQRNTLRDTAIIMARNEEVPFVQVNQGFSWKVRTAKLPDAPEEY